MKRDKEEEEKYDESLLVTCLDHKNVLFFSVNELIRYNPSSF